LAFLCDRYTPQYQAKYDACATQVQRILSALSTSESGLTLQGIRDLTGQESGRLSPYLKLMTDQGLIEKEASMKRGATYQISDSLFAVWLRKFGFYPTHPGEVLKEEIEYRKISQRKLASGIGMSHTALNEILNGKRPVSTTSAYLFEAALGIPASMLLKIQMQYDMQMAESDKSLLSRLAAIRKVAAVF
jgi:addiction module HigA family antidote